MQIDDKDENYNVRIAPFAAQPDRFVVEITRPHCMWGAHTSAEVFTYIFRGTPDEAEEYAAALAKAVEIARKLDEDYDPEKDPHTLIKKA